MTIATATSKKRGLGRGVEALIPEKTAYVEATPPRQTQWQLISEAVGKVGLTLSETLPSLDDRTRDIALEAIIGLCQAELKSGR